MSTPPTRPHRAHRPVAAGRSQNRGGGFAIDPVPATGSAQSAAPARNKQKKPQGTLKTLAKRCINAVAVAISACAALALIISAYSAHIDPAAHPWAAVAALAFQPCLWAAFAILALDLWLWKRTAWIPGLAIIACSGAVAAYMPLHFPSGSLSSQEAEHAFSLMTYNAMKFYDSEYDDLTANRQLEYIIENKPDVVCIQESRFLSPSKENNIRQYQIDSLSRIYPYILTSGSEFTILSRFPTEPINLDFPAADFQSGNMAAWRLNIQGRIVNLFSVHLRSFSLTQQDKDAYRDIIELDTPNRSDLRQAKSDIIPKIEKAGAERSKQIQYLNKYLKKYGGENAIVAGDFNDPVNSYAVSSLCATSHMRQAYAEVGFLPLPTYNASRLYFRIDHILYRGTLRPTSIKRGKLRASDHYPLTATFLLN